MAKNIIADSSALVALLRYDDQYHRWLDVHIDKLPKPWLTCEPALTEAMYLVGAGGTPAIKSLLRRGALVLSFDLAEHLEPVLGLMDKYSSVPMSLADACLVRVTEILPDPLLVTTDGDFRIYRRHGRRVIPCLMP